MELYSLFKRLVVIQGCYRGRLDIRWNASRCRGRMPAAPDPRNNRERRSGFVFPVAVGVGRHPMLGSFWALDRFRSFLLSDQRCARFNQTRLSATRSLSARSVIVEQAAECEREGVSQLLSGTTNPFVNRDSDKERRT